MTWLDKLTAVSWQPVLTLCLGFLVVNGARNRDKSQQETLIWSSNSSSAAPPVVEEESLGHRALDPCEMIYPHNVSLNSSLLWSTNVHL